MPLSPLVQRDETVPADAARQDEAPLFSSILFDDSRSESNIDGTPIPEFFTDLNLDQIVDAVTAGREEYSLKPFFYAPLQRAAMALYRHEILRDLENSGLYAAILSFAAEMRTVRQRLAQSAQLYYQVQKRFQLLDGAELYCAALLALSRNLKNIPLRSHGVQRFRTYLYACTESAAFNRLRADVEKLRKALNGVRYSLLIDGNRITVTRYGGEPDYSADVLETFAKFSQSEARDYKFGIPFELEMNHVEAAILDCVARLFPETFEELKQFAGNHSDFINRVVARFDREVQFYIAWIDYTRSFQRAGLRVCYPTLSDQSKSVHADETYDLSLANRLLEEKLPIVTNDFHLNDPERILVVSGPNQGGKTTFARTFGQLHYLAKLGLTVPGSAAQLFFCDRLFTHFEREEKVQSLHGKLEDELFRIREILDRATPASILVMNESFLSTAIHDALALSKQIMQRIIDLDMLCVSVTFLDELATLSEKTVSMVSTVNRADPAIRTFRIVRQPANGLAYAIALAEKHKLTYPMLKERLTDNARGERQS